MPPKGAPKLDAAAEKRRLPAKENSLFQTIAKSYERKEYKKGLKVRMASHSLSPPLSSSARTAAAFS